MNASSSARRVPRSPPARPAHWRAHRPAGVSRHAASERGRDGTLNPLRAPALRAVLYARQALLQAWDTAPAAPRRRRRKRARTWRTFALRKSRDLESLTPSWVSRDLRRALNAAIHRSIHLWRGGKSIRKEKRLVDPLEHLNLVNSESSVADLVTTGPARHPHVRPVREAGHCLRSGVRVAPRLVREVVLPVSVGPAGEDGEAQVEGLVKGCDVLVL